MTPEEEATTRKEIVGRSPGRHRRPRIAPPPRAAWPTMSRGGYRSRRAQRGLDRPLRGREPVLELLCGESRYEIGTMVWEHHQVLHDGDFVIAHCSLRATTRSGRDYENQYALVYRFDALLITEAWEHTDTAYAFSRFAD